MKIKVGARGSKLSRKQVEEVMQQLKVDYTVDYLETIGDLDLKSPLGPMDKTDFFTREIDQKVLDRGCDVGIHSAKDLPDPLPKGLQLLALTRGVDSSDSLVIREGKQFKHLKKGAIIGSSSFRRNEVIKRLRSDLKCIEVRGAIDVRLAMLDRGEIDGLVVAEAALIRLGLTARNRMILPDKTAPLQGKLAVIGRNNDKEMEALFHPIDGRHKTKALYLGLNPKHYEKKVVHLPIIEISPRSFDDPAIVSAFADIPDYTHLIFTSKTTVEIFYRYLEKKSFSSADLNGKEVIAVGKVTAKHLQEKEIKVDKIAENETQEGIMHLLALEDMDQSYVFLPQSSKARCALSQTLVLRGVRHQRCILYDTKPKIPSVKPHLESFDEIIFTSPSTIDAFRKIFGRIPMGKKITAVGPVTRSNLRVYL
ncbi:MAG: hydroxymethylbilane synthase [Simkaniaceae bacterium]|nr:hydroxymethylbilane synthase [Simkaniaceae bacterium]